VGDAYSLGVAVLLPETVDDAVDALARHPGAHVLAGGTDLMVEVNAGHRRPEVVVALRKVAEVRDWHHDPRMNSITIGAGVTFATLETAPFTELVPALAEAARTVGSPQIRNAATVGGNLGTASPAGDSLPVLSALDAVVTVAGPLGRREISIHDLFTGVKRTSLAPGELVVSLTVPVLDGYQGYAKVGVRNAMVIAIASVCLAVDGRGRNVRIALGAVGPTVIRARRAEAWLAARLTWGDDGAVGPVDDPTAAELGDRVAAEASPIDDHRSTAAYRRHAVGVLAGRLLARAAAAGRRR
jgi:CO/xanthine dehydrogenase FAD-binding subunit